MVDCDSVYLLKFGRRLKQNSAKRYILRRVFYIIFRIVVIGSFIGTNYFFSLLLELMSLASSSFVMYSVSDLS